MRLPRRPRAGDARRSQVEDRTTSRTEKLLLAYSGVLTLSVVAFLLSGAASGRSATFERIQVQRIDVREADGTLRLVISNRGRFPGATFGNTREYRHDRQAAGILFFNDEGTENGGLVFNGAKDGQGKVDSFGHLSFDPYDRDQAVALNQSETGGVVRAGLTINDTGTRSIESAIKEVNRIQDLPAAERAPAQQALEAREAAQGSVRRVYVGKDRAQDSLLLLADAKGRPRLRLRVTPAGDARIEFLDEGGQVARSIAPDLASSKR